MFTGKRILTVLSVLCIIWVCSWSLHRYLTTPPPQKSFTHSRMSSLESSDQMPSGIGEDPISAGLREQALADPENPEKWREVVSALHARIASELNPPQGLVLDMIDALSRILKLNPEDSRALLMMAGVAFDQGVYSKAVVYYERYIRLHPDELSARANHAAALIFTGQIDEAVKELEYVLSKDSGNFQAAAYMTLALAEKGDITGAKARGTEALKLAPDDDARARLNSFLSSLDSSQSSGQTSR